MTENRPNKPKIALKSKPPLSIHFWTVFPHYSRVDHSLRASNITTNSVFSENFSDFIPENNNTLPRAYPRTTRSNLKIIQPPIILPTHFEPNHEPTNLKQNLDRPTHEASNNTLCPLNKINTTAAATQDISPGYTTSNFSEIPPSSEAELLPVFQENNEQQPPDYVEEARYSLRGVSRNELRSGSRNGLNRNSERYRVVSWKLCRILGQKDLFFGLRKVIWGYTVTFPAKPTFSQTRTTKHHSKRAQEPFKTTCRGFFEQFRDPCRREQSFFKCFG